MRIDSVFALRALAVVALAMLMTLLTAQAKEPRVFILDGPELTRTRDRARAGDEQLTAAVAQLRHEAQATLEAGPYTVVNKEATPPSGDKHDYMSLAPYWWPNPETADGMPFVRRDGERNPEIYKVRDRLQLGEMIDATETLALAYYFTGDEEFAARARLLIRTWFLDHETRMNPHLEFGQAIPGENTGRGAGLIETRSLTRIVDSAGLLLESDAWTDVDQRELQEWFEEFLTWMRTSKNGREEAQADNNHGTYYDVQVASYSYFVGNRELAAAVLSAAGEKRIADQIEPDGRQPRELERTKAWSYSVGNLAGLMSLARLGEHADVDLWRYESEDGRSIRAALDFLAPFGVEERPWSYQQINGFAPELSYPLLRIAAEKYPDARYGELLKKLPSLELGSRGMLLVSPLEPITKLHVK